MNNELLKERKKLEAQTGINTDKYLTEKTIKDVSEYLEFCLTFSFTLIIYPIILTLIFFLLSIGMGFLYKSALLAILLFISSLIISILCGSIMGLRIALIRSLTGINGIGKYSFELVTDIYTAIDENRKKEELPSISDIFKLVVYSIILPVINIIINRKVPIIGGFIYWIIENILFNFTKLVTNDMDTIDIKDDSSDKKMDKPSKIVKIINTISLKINDFSVLAIKHILNICSIFNIIFLIIGIVPILLIFSVYK